MLVAAQLSVHSMETGKMKTRTIHSEIMFRLWTGGKVFNMFTSTFLIQWLLNLYSKQITDAFRVFGVTPSSTQLLIVLVNAKPEQVRIIIKFMIFVP